MKVKIRRRLPPYALKCGDNLPIEIVECKTGKTGVCVYGFENVQLAQSYFGAIAIANQILKVMNKGD